MSLERPDIRARVSPECKDAIQAICHARGITEADFIEQIVCREVTAIVHEAESIAAALEFTKKSATTCDKPGVAPRQSELDRLRAGMPPR